MIKRGPSTAQFAQRLRGLQRGAEPFLVRRALTRSILRRQSSSRVLQRCWRAFAAKQLTTRALAARFTATGVPATVPVSPAALILQGRVRMLTRFASAGQASSVTGVPSLTGLLCRSQRLLRHVLPGSPRCEAAVITPG